MSSPPVDAHNEEFEELAGLAALGSLEGDDLASFEQHAASCQRCQVMVRLDRYALAHLTLAAVPMDPSPDFKARLMRRASEELASAATAPHAPSEPTPIRPLPGNVIPFWRGSSARRSVLAAVLVLGLAFGGYAFENQTVGTYELNGSAAGKAVVVVRRSGAAELDMQGVPDPGPGFVYEAWIIAPGGQPVAAGTTPTGTASVPLPGNLNGTTVAVTRERSRVDAPTSPPLLVGVVQS